jgi:N6-adenosine-specific RNA methylase IME4
MESLLVKYHAARQALAEAHRVDEVKEIRDKAIAMQVYAQQARDTELIEHATEIRLRAEIRAGELLNEMARHGQRDNGKGNRNPALKSQCATPKLADLGVTKSQSSRWQQKAALPPDKQEEMIARAKKTAIAAVATDRAAKAERRAEREVELAARIVALPAKRYGVILADPPWRFEPYSRDTGMDRAADNHYPTMTLDSIKALEIPAARDAVLFLWATVPMLREALDVMETWGFPYRSHFVWVKDRPGTGYWARNQHELLLVGVRGEIPAPAPGQQYPTVVAAPLQRHSAKPLCVRAMIEAMFPSLPRIELFARESAAGWDAWGNEAMDAATPMSAGF